MTAIRLFTCFAIGLAALLPVAAAASATDAPVKPGAESQASSPSKVDKPYISKPAKDGVFRVVVMGDSLADGLHQGLTRLNSDREDLKFVKKSKVNTGFVRVDRYDWNKNGAALAKGGDYDIAVVLLGLNDLQSFREKGKAYHYQTKGWVERYQERTERLMSDLKTAGMAVYWVGIPITSPKRYQKDYDYLNTFYRDAARKTGVRFIDTWAALADDNGAYSPYWKDAEGKSVEIRRRDGVHFTTEGYLIFAGIVNDAIRKDLDTRRANAVGE